MESLYYIIYLVMYFVYSHQLTVAGRLVLLVTEKDAVCTFLVYCMKQTSNILSLACDTECNEELILTTMLSVLKV